jgi:hypothetical protein
MSQEDLLAAEDRIEILTEAEARVYQLSVADLEKVTGLNFGPLKAADTLKGDEALTVPVLLGRIEDTRLA